jgi:hypothetical protein
MAKLQHFVNYSVDNMLVLGAFFMFLPFFDFFLILILISQVHSSPQRGYLTMPFFKKKQQ